MYRKTIFKEAVVLLCTALMIFSTGAVIANTSTPTLLIKISKETTMNSPIDRSIIWDNVVGVHGSLGGIIVGTVRDEGIAFPADDFKLDAEREVNSLFWQGGYFQCQLAEGQKDYHWDWRILFWNDVGDGSHPGTEIYNQTIPDASITRDFWYNYTHTNGNTYWVANYSAELPVPIIFNADTTYWITIQTIQASNQYPQGCWSRHNNTDGGIKLHEAIIKAEWWGFPDWTNISDLVTDQLPHDLNYQLLGEGGDTTPPVTTVTLDGDLSGDVYISDVEVTLTATDAESGVNFTMYKVDDDVSWTTYTDPFIVSGNGDHSVAFYSVDIAGNIEEEKSTTFTIQYPIELTIAGGIGVKVTIKNTGTTNLTNVDWSITLDGSLIFIGKTKSGTIDSLSVGDSVTVKDFVLGFGTTGIAVEAGGVDANKTGTALLIFVIGVT